MQNNWFNILKLDRYKDENIAILLDKYLYCFAFKGYDAKGNIVLVYKKDNKEYTAKYSNNILYIKINSRNSIEKEKLELELKLCNYNKLYLSEEKPYYLDFKALELNIKEIKSTNLSSKYEIYKTRVNYFNNSYSDVFLNNSRYELKKDDYDCNINIFSEVYYLDKNIKSYSIYPDVSCSTNIHDDNGYKVLTKSCYYQGVCIKDKDLELKVGLPICYVIDKEHDDFLDSVCKEKQEKIKKLTNNKKMGFI